MELHARGGGPAPTQPAAPSANRARWPMRFLIAIVSLLFATGSAELVLRVFFKERLEIVEDERYLLYRYDDTLGWYPAPNTRQRLRASRVFTVTHNSRGFRAAEPEGGSGPAIVFLGDSYVWGYDVEAEERFTDQLQARHPNWQVLNFGVSGYGTDQEYLLLQRHFDTYKPRIVFLVFCTNNDDDDNRTNMRYGGYFKPYCVIDNTRLQLRGVPVPRSERAWLADHPRLRRSYLARLIVRPYFKATCPPVLMNPSPTGAILRDLQKFVLSKQAVLLVGLTEPNPKLEEFLDFFKIPRVDLSTELRYPEFGSHWTPEGHRVVADKVDDFLQRGRFLDPE